MHFRQWKRRDFITLCGGAAAAWPVAARAQQPNRMRRIGVLTPYPADDAKARARLTAFAQGLAQTGWTVGQNIRIDYRWGDGKPDTMRKYAAELVALAPEVILASSSAALAPLLEAFPKLQILRARGGEGLVLSELKHGALRALALETGGMNASVVRSVLNGHLPELEYLELWLGTEEYGGTCTVEDLQPLFKGKKFPKLRYLGLRNCDFVDDIATVIVNSPLVQRLDTLDLSLGTLSDVGGQALVKLPANSSLKRLDLRHHFMTKQVTKELKKLSFAVDVSDAQDSEDDWRFVAIGE